MPSKFLIPAVLLLSLVLFPGLGRAAAEPAPTPPVEVLLTTPAGCGK